MFDFIIGSILTAYRINTNVSKMAFWIIAYLMYEPGLIGTIRQEIEPAFKPDSSIDDDILLRQCPRLESVWYECLRLCAASTALRTLEEDTWIGRKLLKKGAMLAVSARQLHFNGKVFGSDYAAFKSDRFLQRPSLKRNASFRPFGGGSTLCPGRHLAKYMVFVFIADVLHRFDLSLDGEQDFPRAQQDRPTIGILNGESDIRVRIRERLYRD